LQGSSAGSAVAASARALVESRRVLRLVVRLRRRHELLLAAALPDARYDEVARAHPRKKIVVGEVGWPCRGPTIDAAIPSLDNQARFVREFLATFGSFFSKPRILVLACENDAYPALDMAGLSRTLYSAFVRIIPVRCLGSVNTIWITDALNSGYDGVMMMGCKKGDDYQCHFVKGSELAHYRMSKIGDTLTQLGLEPERVVTHEVAITDSRRVARLIDEYVAQINEIGMSPMKGFG